MWKADVCIHHSPCDDGFAAAWVARRKWPEVTIKGTNYGLPFPEVDIAGKNVLIADFSYGPGVLETLAPRARSIVILDHHKTAEADLAAFKVELRGEEKFVAAGVDATFHDLAALERPAIAAHFDMQRSGASLTGTFASRMSHRPYSFVSSRTGTFGASKFAGDARLFLVFAVLSLRI